MSRNFGICGEIVISGGGGLPKLAPDLTFPEDKTDGNSPIKAVTAIDATGAPTTILSLSGGGFIVSYLAMTNMTSNDVVLVKLTIDGVIIWNVNPSTNGTNEVYIGLLNSAGVPESYECASSFLFEMQTTADTSINCNYVARPIL